MKELPKKYHVPALDKALAIIEMLASQDEPLGVSEICKLVDLPKTSVFFILNTLDQNQYVSKTEDGKYKLGTKFINLGLTLLSKIDIRQFAAPLMKKLMHETGFTVHLAILDKYEAIYVEKMESQSFVKFSTFVGQRQSLHASGVGKALASQLSEENVDLVIQHVGLPAKTENTITTAKDFKAALEVVRVQGYAVEDEEGEYGVRCIGACIFGHNGKMEAAISITALRSELPVQDIPGVALKIKQTARQISELLGYKPNQLEQEMEIMAVK
jgi:DNA-binding IclR family transcriptional regulator